MRRYNPLSALAVLILSAAPLLYGQGAPQGCAWSDPPFTAAITGPPHANTGVPCINWRVTYFADGMTTLSMQFEGTSDLAGLPDPSNWAIIAGGAITQGTNPLIDPNSGTLATTGTVYYPWLRLNVTVFTPIGASGKITSRIYGAAGITAALPGGGGGAIAHTLDLLAGNNLGAAIDSTIPYTPQPVTAIGIGADAGLAQTGTYVYALGDSAAADNTGINVVAIGAITDGMGGSLGAAQGNTGNDVVAIGSDDDSGFPAAYENTGSETVALGGDAAYKNTGVYVFAALENAAANNVGPFVFAIGPNAASGNSGEDIFAVGSGAASQNTGNNVNALGDGSAFNSTGDYVDAIGQNAANGNSGNEVIAIGRDAAQNNAFDNIIDISMGTYTAGWQPTQDNDAEFGDPSFALTHLYGNVSLYGGAFSVPQLPTPAAPTVTPTCGTAPCMATWGYKVVAVMADGTTTTDASPQTATSAQNATLSPTESNHIGCTEVPGASFYQIRRSTVATSPATTGIIGTLAYLSCAAGLVDDGLPGDNSPDPTVNATGRFGPMTTEGDMIYALPGGAAARVPPNTSPSIPKVLTQTNSAQPVWSVITTGGLLYYFTDTASSIASTLQATLGAYSPKTTLGPYAVINGTQTIQQFATNAGNPGVTSIPTGIYEVHVHYSRSPAPIGTITLQAIIEEVSATGVYIGTIGTTEQTPVINPQGGEQEADLAYADSSPYVMSDATSRVMVLIQAISTSATPTVNLYAGGTADAHIALPGTVGVNGVSLIAKGSQDLGGIGAIASADCSAPLQNTATGVVTTDIVTASFNGDPSGIVGFMPSLSGMLTVFVYPDPAGDLVDVKVCNNTAAPLAPGTISVNYQVVR